MTYENTHASTTNSKEFFNLPPEKRRGNGFLRKKEEKPIVKQILNKVFPGLRFSKSNSKPFGEEREIE